MSGKHQTLGDEPSMYLQRPSTGKSQDVRHILVRTFRELFTRDAIGPDTVKNLSVSKGGDDPYHERYVDALQKVFNERQRRMEEAAMLERHIMQAQARAMSADERELNRIAQSCDNYQDLGMPPVHSNFRTCLDTELLRKYELLTPADYSTEERPAVEPPAVEKVPSYARGTMASRMHNKDDSVSMPLSPVESVDGSHSDIGSLMSEEPLDKQKFPKETRLNKFPRNDAWKEQLSEDQREIERIYLKNLNAMTDYQRNPRLISPSASLGRSLIKGKKIKTKEIGIESKPETSPEPKEPSQTFLVSPPTVTFTDYKIGQVYELTLTLKNVSACIRQCRALPASTSFFSIGLGQFPGEHGFVAPGMSCHYAVRFNPDSLRDYDDEIKIQTQSREPIIVPLLGRRPPPKLTIPRVMDVGYCLLGGCQITHFMIKNAGGSGRFCVMPSNSWPTTSFKSVVRNGNVPIPPFEIRPSVLEIGPNQTGFIEVVFQPPAVKTYSVDMCMVCDNCNVKHFTLKGEGQRAHVEIVSVERGMSEPLPGELTDVTAQCLIKFDQLNPFTYTDRTAVVKNPTNVSLPFQWMIYKPQFESSGADLVSRKYDHVPDVDSVFSVHPPTGVLPACETMEFKITYAPPVVDKFHSVLHLLLNMVPAFMEMSHKGSATSDKNSTKYSDDKSTEDKEEDMSEIILPHNDMAPFGDVTALEIEVKGESVPLSVVLHPYSMLIPGKHLMGTTLKKMVTMANHSHSTITFQWEPYTEKYILEVEPPFGELDPGMAMDMELSVTGPEPGMINHTLYCHVMNLEEPLHLQVQAEFKGPEVSVDEPNLNFGLVRLGETVKKEFTINNMAQIVTSWSVKDSPAAPIEDCEDIIMKTLGEFVFEPSSGDLKPLESVKVLVTFHPMAVKTLRRVIEVLVQDGTTCNIACFAEVQTVQACLIQCELNMSSVCIGVPMVVTARLLNQTLLSSAFEWGEAVGQDCSDCYIEMEPKNGEIKPLEEKQINVNFTAFREGEFNELRVPCKVEGMDVPLILALYCNSKGLSVQYHVSKNGRDQQRLDKLQLDYGIVSLKSIPKLYLHVKNNTSITALYSFVMENFFSKPPTPPLEDKRDDQQRAISTRRMMLGKTPNLADPLSKTMTKAQTDLCTAMLSQGFGAAFVPLPAFGTLAAYSEEIIEVSAFSDMWGQYEDNIICKVGELEAVKIPVKMSVEGCPLIFQVTSAMPDLKPMVRFGTFVAGTSPCHRKMRVKNTSPFDIRVDWQVFNIVEQDTKLLDLIICYGKPFPLRYPDGREIVPPAEVPIPVIREPTDHIANSVDTSCNVSREVTQTVIDTEQENTAASQQVVDVHCPKVISLFCHKHEGHAGLAPFSIKPAQLVIPAKSHASVTVIFTPHPTEDITNDVNCDGYILGYMSLDEPKIREQDGKLSRLQAYSASQLRLDMTAYLKPALLTIECAEEEGMKYRSAMSNLLKDDGQLLSEDLQTCSVMLSNLTMTHLIFQLVVNEPFLLVDMDPSSNASGSSRTQATELHTLKPRHNLIVKVAFRTTTELLSKIAEKYSSNEPIEDSGQKLEIEDNLIVKFNNEATQLIPLHATLTVPQYKLSKQSLDFGTCLVGQTRELQLMISNKTLSHTYWSVCQESKSESCAVDTFQVEPSRGFLEAHITLVSNSKALLHVFFTAKHAENYEAIFTFQGILGERPERLHVCGQGSYDGKHEAILDV